MKIRKKINDSKYTQVGVDIGNFSIKVATIKKQALSRKKTFSFGIEHIPPDATFEQKAELIKKALKDADITTQRVNISVSGPNVMCRYIHLPVMHRYELAKALELEWDNYISLKMDEVIWDYMLLDTSKDIAGHKQMRVLLVAAKKNFIDERLRLFKASGLEVQFIDVDSLALINAFNSIQTPDKKQPIMLLNIGEYFTNLVVLRKGKCWFSRDLPLGGHDITQALVDKFHLNWLEAESLKCNLDNQKADALTILRTVLDNLMNELNLSLDYLKRELEEQVEYIYISGGSAHLFQLEEFLSKNLNIPVKKWNPAWALQLSPGLSQEKLVSYAPNLAVAIGLALAKKVI
jgi:type IV pilus assembly protein PilM